MTHRTAGIAAVALVAALAGTPAVAADEAPSPAATGWVVENPSPDGIFATNEGSVSVVGAGTGVAITCPVLSGWGRADSATLRPNDFFGETGVTNAGDCTGPGSAGVEVISSPGTVFVAETYAAAADRIGGSAYPWLWGLFLEAPDCQVDLYAVDANAPAPLAYDNATATLEAGPIDVVATRAEGTGCADLATVGDRMTFQARLVATPGFTVHPAP